MKRLISVALWVALGFAICTCLSGCVAPGGANGEAQRHP